MAERGGVSISPNSRNTSHSFTCHLPASSKFAPKMQNKCTSNCPLINVNLCAATEQQWRKGGATPPWTPTTASLKFPVSNFDSSISSAFVKNYLKYNSTIVVMNENLYVTTEEQWRQTGANPPPTNHWNFHFWSCDLLRASIFDKNAWNVAAQLHKCVDEWKSVYVVIEKKQWRKMGLNPPALLRFSFSF